MQKVNLHLSNELAFFCTGLKSERLQFFKSLDEVHSNISLNLKGVFSQNERKKLQKHWIYIEIDVDLFII